MMEVKSDSTRKLSPDLEEIFRNAMYIKMPTLEDASITPPNKEEIKRFIERKLKNGEADEEYCPWKRRIYAMIDVKRSDDTRKVSPELAEILKNAFCVRMKDLEDSAITPTNKEELKRYIRANKNILKAEKEYYERKFKENQEDKPKKTTEKKSKVDLEDVLESELDVSLE